jgi:hypothetical protein
MQTVIAEILAAWRRAERLAEELEADSPQHRAAVLAAGRLRDLYRELTASGVLGDDPTSDEVSGSWPAEGQAPA